VIRGVSDFGDGYKSDRFHPLASQTAATVLVDFLQYCIDLLPSNSNVPEISNNEEIKPKDLESRLQKYNTSQLEQIITQLQVDKNHIRMNGTKYQIIVDLIGVLETKEEGLTQLHDIILRSKG
jgi:hypothetical protein